MKGRYSQFSPAGLIVLAIVATPVSADERALRTPLLPRYQQECSSCHVAYPPGLLPAASWQRLIGGLPRHFGTDASLDAPAAAELNTWLTANAARPRRAVEVPPEDRITRSFWFARKHHEVPLAVWKRPAIGSAANCAACHPDAAQGRFDEDSVQLSK